ncbi:hypothetical protein D3C81_1188070 [compost metagenome]
MITPETMIAAMNIRNAPPALAAAPNSTRPVSLSCGIMLFSTSLRLSEAASHKAYRRGPSNGQEATDSGGAGTLQAPLLSSVSMPSTDSVIDTTTR